MKLTTYLHKLVKSVLARISELKTAKPSRPVILAGWGAAAAINCQVSLMDLDQLGNMVMSSSAPPPPPGAAPGKTPILVHNNLRMVISFTTL